jgi:hypothetical protein
MDGIGASRREGVIRKGPLEFMQDAKKEGTLNEVSPFRDA